MANALYIMEQNANGLRKHKDELQVILSIENMNCTQPLKTMGVKFTLQANPHSGRRPEQNADVIDYFIYRKFLINCDQIEEGND